MTVTRFIEDRTGWSIRKFVRSARRYRPVQIRVGQHVLAGEDPLPPDLRDASPSSNSPDEVCMKR